MQSDEIHAPATAGARAPEPPRAPSRLRLMHPWLFGAYPILFLFEQNRDEVTAGQIVWPLALAAGGTAAVFLLGLAMFRSARKAVLATTLLSVLFFAYGHVYDTVYGTEIGGLVVGRHRFLMPVWMLLGAIAMIAVARGRGGSRGLHGGLSIVAAVLVATTLAGSVLGAGPASAVDIRARTAAIAPMLTPSAGQPRDIYYLVFDRYASVHTLDETYRYDNRPFLTELRRRGFAVADDARANYPNTILSLASALNGSYLDDLLAGASGDHWGPTRDLVRYHAAARALKSAGYRYTHIGSWSETSRVSPLADRNILHGRLSEFQQVLLETTLLGRLMTGLAGEDGKRRIHRTNALKQFDEIASVAGTPGPDFVFAHVLLPHPPYVFARDGRFVTREEQLRRSPRQNFTEQLEYTNGRILALLDRLASGPEESRPIVVLTSDEGPYPGRWLRENPAYAKRPTTANPTPQELRMKYQILNALYLPGVQDPGIHSAFSPVNNVRKIFNLYFGTELPLLPDRHYIYTDHERRYDFVEITDRFGR